MKMDSAPSPERIFKATDVVLFPQGESTASWIVDEVRSDDEIMLRNTNIKARGGTPPQIAISLSELRKYNK